MAAVPWRGAVVAVVVLGLYVLAVRADDPFARRGKSVAWDGPIADTAAALMRCLGIPKTIPPHRVYVLPDSVPMPRIDGIAVVGWHDASRRTIGVYPHYPFWDTMRHELLHAAIGDSDHTRPEWSRKDCGVVR